MFRQHLVAIVLIGGIAGCDRGATNVASPANPTRPRQGEPLRVRMTGRDFKWHLRYPGPDRQLDTADDVLAQRHLHVPTDTAVEIELRSDDNPFVKGEENLSQRQIARKRRIKKNRKLRNIK
ncbi:MAG: hypothetical protein IIC60_07520 [Proteobacteria bacterium]|nr:hypothetical protein [Pseudomonadota bacterium]